MTQYADLIARVEKASGPDRELDIEIFRAVVAVPNEGQMVGVEPRQWDPRYTPLLVPHPKWGFSPAVSDDAERYTASIDAALTLAPEGANCWGFDKTPIGSEAYFSRNHVSDGHWYVSGFHCHSAIAICIAALRAREQLETKG